MRRPLKVRSLAAQKSGALFGFRLLRGDGTKPSLANLFPHFVRPHVVAVQPRVAVAKMFFGGKTFKVFGPVIRLISVNMVHMLAGVKRFQPTLRHYTVRKFFVAKRGVPISPQYGVVGKKISENFSATRDCKKVVDESVMDSVYFNADHVVPIGS